MPAVRIFDCDGAQLVLGREIGRGGEGVVYEIQGRPGSVAKIYLKQPTPDHGAKLSAMADLSRPNLLSLAALPTSTLHGSSRAVIGFVMPKVTGHSPVFKTYIPKLRMQEFPKADWRFLIHTAANVGRAFSIIHASGLVIGDVNHGNLVVAQDGTVRLIDCDSFQVSNGKCTWFCPVGVGTHQPPELQGIASFSGVTRTPNHDNFGLAIIIFQLLCVARHPFAGRYIASGNPPTIEEAIAQSRYAYSRDRRRTMMIPPPGSLPIDALTPELQDLFEAAFAPMAAKGGRPTGDLWVAALQQLRSSLRECANNQGHHYLSSLPHCPWCNIEMASGIPLFPVVFVSKPGQSTGIAALWQEVARIAEPPPLPSLPDPNAVKTKPSAAAQALGRHGRKLQVAAYGSIAASILAALVFAPSGADIFIAVAAGVLTAVILKTSQAAGASAESRQFEDVKRDWETLRRHWTTPSSGGDVLKIRREIEAFKAKYDDLPLQRAKRLQQLSEQRRQKQLSDHLDRFAIASARIPGVGPAKAAMLSSNGIDTAGDIERSRILSIPGFGEIITNRLVMWRRLKERTFVFDQNRSVSPSDIAAVERDISIQRTQLERDVAMGLGRLKAATASVNANRQALQRQASELMPRYAQAAADARVASYNNIATKRLLVLAATTLGVVLLSLVPNKSPQAERLTLQSTPVASPPPHPPPPLPQVAPASPAAVPSLAVNPDQVLPEPSTASTSRPSLLTPASTPAIEQPIRHVMTLQAANVRESASNTSAVLRTVPKGMVLRAFDRSAGWVRIGDQTPWGWVYSGLLADAP